MAKNFNGRAIRDARLEEDLAEYEASRRPQVDSEGNPIEVVVKPKEEETWEKRYADLRSFSQKRENELKKDIESIKAQLADAAKKQIKFPKTKEEVSEWISKYPDVAAIVETIAMEKVEQVREELAADRAVVSERAYEVERDRCFAKIMKAHPDFIDLSKDEKFKVWAQNQPRRIRDALYEDGDYDELEDIADTVVAAVDLYKAKYPVKAPVQAPDDRREAARGTGRTPGSMPRDSGDDSNKIYESQVEKMNSREYALKEAEIDLAVREGRFVYDLSGAAR